MLAFLFLLRLHSKCRDCFPVLIDLCSTYKLLNSKAQKTRNKCII